MDLFRLTSWPTLALFVLAGCAGALLAFATVNLFSQATANIGFIREHGLEAIRYGALLQLFELIVMGAVALLCWITFKICEQILEDRFLTWSQRGDDQKETVSGQTKRSAE